MGDVAHRHPAVIAMARLGWVAKGIVYGLIGALAVPIAIEGLRSDRARDGDQEASPLGVVAAVAEKSLGVIALWIVAVGLALYVVWRLISIVLPAENSLATWFTRAGYAVSAVMYSFLAWSAMSFATNDRATRGAETEDAKVERLTRELMDTSAGRWLVGAIGVCLVGVGLYFVVKGVRASFHDDLNPVASARSASRRSSCSAVSGGSDGRRVDPGRLVRHQSRCPLPPADAQGLDGSLRQVTELAVGPLIVGFAALALVAYGLFCMISAPRQSLTGAH